MPKTNIILKVPWFPKVVPIGLGFEDMLFLMELESKSEFHVLKWVDGIIVNSYGPYLIKEAAEIHKDACNRVHMGIPEVHFSITEKFPVEKDTDGRDQNIST